MEFFEHNSNNICSEVNKEQIDKQKQEFTLIGKQRRIPGLTLFSFNTVTKEIKPAQIEYSKDVSIITKKPTQSPKVVIEKDCIYRQALNKKNFIKIIRREGFEL